jgi:hypothetical protein
LYIVPQADDIPTIQSCDEGGCPTMFPRRAVLFSFLNGKPEVRVIDNFVPVYHFKHWQDYCGAVNNPGCENTAIRVPFRFSLSATAWKFEIKKPDGSWWTHQGSFGFTLSFTKGVLHYEHHSYNPEKDNVPVLSRTFHWDNIRFDGPVIGGTPSATPTTPMSSATSTSTLVPSFTNTPTTPPTVTPVPATNTATSTPSPLPPTSTVPASTSTLVPPTSTMVVTPTVTPTLSPEPVCELRVRVNGIEGWVVKPLSWCLP